MKRYILTLLTIVFCIQASTADNSFEKAGDLLQYAIPAAGLGMVLGKKDMEGFWQYSKSFAVSIVATQGLKYSINRKRPNGGKHSFPSGHTSASFTGAAFMQRRYGWEYGAPAYAAAMYVGWSRVQAKKHHISDVLAGAAIGIISAYIFTKPYEDYGIQVAMFAEHKAYGLRVGKEF